MGSGRKTNWRGRRASSIIKPGRRRKRVESAKKGRRGSKGHAGGGDPGHDYGRGLGGTDDTALGAGERLHFAYHLGADLQEGGGALRVELAAALLLDLGEGHRGVHALAVGPVGGHGVE